MILVLYYKENPKLMFLIWTL